MASNIGQKLAHLMKQKAIKLDKRTSIRNIDIS